METITYYQQAEELIESAKNEMMKPETDLVPYPVCKNCYKAIRAFLKGYLQQSNVSFDENANIRELLNMAIDQDKKFKAINASFLKHPEDTEDIWMNIDFAKDFIQLAEKTRELVQS